MNASVPRNASAVSPAPWLASAVGLCLAVWVATVAWTALDGVLSRLAPPLIALVVAATIALPSLVYFRSPSLRTLAARIGLVPLTALHLWRVPAGLVFYAYGLAGELPPLFWILAGTGDLIAGVYAAGSLRAAPTLDYFRRFHLLGFADFVVAVGTGLAFTLMGDPRMAPIAQWPLALIPLFGVGVSGTAHLIAFDLLRKERRGDRRAGDGLPA